jgi:hypothetical protein
MHDDAAMLGTARRILVFRDDRLSRPTGAACRWSGVAGRRWTTPRSPSWSTCAVRRRRGSCAWPMARR